ncbi:pyridoxamine 5'-phosphate oxidase family protein [Streptomyces violaceorubidus]
MSEGTIAFRTAPGVATAAAVDSEVAFEVDHIDDSTSQGWSVLVVGRCRTVTDPEEVRRLTASAHTEPWACGRRTM